MKTTHMEMEKQMFSKYMFSGPCRDNRTKDFGLQALQNFPQYV